MGCFDLGLAGVARNQYTVGAVRSSCGKCHKHGLTRPRGPFGRASKAQFDRVIEGAHPVACSRHMSNLGKFCLPGLESPACEVFDSALL